MTDDEHDIAEMMERMGLHIIDDTPEHVRFLLLLRDEQTGQMSFGGNIPVEDMSRLLAKWQKIATRHMRRRHEVQQ